MNSQNAKRVGIGAILIALLSGLLAVAAANFRDDLAEGFCDKLSMQSFIAASSDAHYKADMQQQLDACNGKDLDKDNSLAEKIPNSGSTATTSAAPQPTVTVTVTPSATATPTATQAPAKQKHWYDPYDPSKEQFYANWRPSLKTSVNSYGPNRPVSPALQGKSMEQLNADQALAEHLYVNERDRMQTASAMVYLGLSHKDINSLIRAYVKDKELWNHDKKLVAKKLSEMKRRVIDTPAGTHATTLRALPGDVPIVDSIDVVYPVATRWIVYTDAQGHRFWFRLKCKLQPRLFTETKQVPQAPATRPGITRTHEGTPVRTKPHTPEHHKPSTGTPTPTPTHTKPHRKVPVCVDHGRRIILVPPSEAHKFPRPDSRGNCAKDANLDPVNHGNAGNGGGKNQDPGPGAVTTPKPAPSTPRVNPAPPSAPAPTKSQPAPPPAEHGATDPTAPATGCATAPDGTCG